MSRSSKCPRRHPAKAIYYDEHELVEPTREIELTRHAWEWADVDRDRVVWAKDGCLWAGRIDARSAKLDDPIAGATLLHDFSDMKLEAIRAPYDVPEPERPVSRRKARRR